jgi:hypothetical protein
MISKLCIKMPKPSRLARIAILLLVSPLILTTTSSGQDLQSGLALWLSHPITPCAPNDFEDDSWASSGTCAPAQAPPLDVSKLHGDVRAVTQAHLENEEKDFFYDYTHDQIKETHCEMNLLDALDQLPGLPDAPRDLNLGSSGTIAQALTMATMDDSESNKIDPAAYANQKAILDDIWSKLPELAKRKKAMNEALAALPASMIKDIGTIQTEPLAGPGHYEDMKAKFNAYTLANASYHALMNQVVTDSGSDKTISDYTETILKEKEQGLTYDQFIRYALQPQYPKRPELSFQQQVVAPLRHVAITRLCDYETFSGDSYERSMWNDGQKPGICGNYKPAGWSADPYQQSNAERQRKRLLMESESPLDFMERTPKYDQDFSEFSCLLIGKYRKGPKILHAGEQLSILAASIAFGGWLKALRAAYSAEELAQLAELSQRNKLMGVVKAMQKVALESPIKARRIAQLAANLPIMTTEECAYDGGYLPKTALEKPVCAQIKPHDPTSASLLTKNLKQTSCLTSIFLTALGAKMLAVGPGSGAAGLAVEMIAPNPGQGSPEDAKDALETILQEDPKAGANIKK